MRLHGLHDDAAPHPAPCDQPIQLNSHACEAHVPADLVGQGYDVARAASLPDRAPTAVLERGDPDLAFGQMAAPAATETDRRDGGQRAAPGRNGVAGPGLFDPLPQTEDTDLGSAASPHRVVDARLNHLVDSAGIKFPGDGKRQPCKHGVRGRGQFRKVNLAVDTATSDNRAIEFTPDAMPTARSPRSCSARSPGTETSAP